MAQSKGPSTTIIVGPTRPAIGAEAVNEDDMIMTSEQGVQSGALSPLEDRVWAPGCKGSIKKRGGRWAATPSFSVKTECGSGQSR